MFWLQLAAVVLLGFIALCAVALVGWARLAVGGLNSVAELLLEQRRWPASSSTLKPGFKIGKSENAN